jgi:hypothetical protein
VVVTWKSKGSDLQKLYGAVVLQLVIAEDATVFAFSFRNTPPPVPTGTKVVASASKGAGMRLYVAPTFACCFVLKNRLHQHEIY